MTILCEKSLCIIKILVRTLVAARVCIPPFPVLTLANLFQMNGLVVSGARRGSRGAKTTAPLKNASLQTHYAHFSQQWDAISTALPFSIEISFPSAGQRGDGGPIIPQMDIHSPYRRNHYFAHSLIVFLPWGAGISVQHRPERLARPWGR